MATIDELSQAGPLSDDDAIPFFSKSAQATRKATLKQVDEYFGLAAIRETAGNLDDLSSKTAQAALAVDEVLANAYAVKSEIDSALPVVQGAASSSQAARDAAQLAKEAAQDASSQAVAVRDTILAGQNSGVIGFDTLASLNASLDYADKTVAYVTSDPTASNNTTYRKTGAAGAGSWVQSSAAFASTLRADAIAKDASTALKSASVRLRPRTRTAGDDVTLSIGGAILRYGVTRNTPRTRTQSSPLMIALGNTAVPIVAESRVAALEQSVAEIDKAGADDGGGAVFTPPAATWLIEPATISGTAQIMAHDGSAYRQITPSGFNWRAPVAGPFNIVRCLGDKTGQTLPYSVTPLGFVMPENGVLLSKLITGQSLSLGSRGYVVSATGQYEFQAGSRGDLFTTEAPYSYQSYCLTLAGGPRPVNWSASTAFEPTREYADGVTGETIASSWSIALRKWALDNTRINPRLLATISGLGGVPYASLKKGTTVYANAMAQLGKAHEIATAQGLAHIVHSVSIIHGESQVDTPQSDYVAMQAEWISNYQADIVALTGQSVAPIAFISQMLTGETGTIPAIPLAQLEAHDTNPAICLIGPKYAYPYFDVYHMLAEGYVKIGEIEARAERFLLAGKKWQPLKPISAVYAGGKIIVTYNNDPLGGVDTPGPIGPLVLDTDTISDPGNYGFAVPGVTVSSVALGKNGRSVELAVSGTPTPGSVVEFALQAGLGAPNTGNGRRGNVRDSDTRDRSRFDGAALYNWSVAHRTAITF